MSRNRAHSTDASEWLHKVGSAKRVHVMSKFCCVRQSWKKRTDAQFLGQDQRRKHFTTSCWIHEKHDRFRSGEWTSCVPVSRQAGYALLGDGMRSRCVRAKKKTTQRVGQGKLLDTLRRIDAWCGGSITQTNQKKSIVTLAATMEDARTHVATRAPV